MEINPRISFVSPVYQAEKSLDKLLFEIQRVMKDIGETYEIIFVDDRSTDKSWEVLQRLSSTHSEVRSFRLSKNFGQHPAILAGLSQSKGEWVVVLDCDLQDQPMEVLKLYNKTKEGYDIVLAKRKFRNDSIIKKFSSFLFSKIFSYFTNTRYDNEVANFGIYHKKVIQSILQISDYIQFFPLFVKLVGYNSTAVEVKHASRTEGKSNYSYKKLVKLAFNVIISYSNKPLKIFVKLGLSISFISFLVGLYHLYLALTNQILVLGYSSLIISIWFLSGVMITIIGVCGLYIGKIFDQTKRRPIYIIDEIL